MQSAVVIALLGFLAVAHAGVIGAPLAYSTPLVAHAPLAYHTPVVAAAPVAYHAAPAVVAAPATVLTRTYHGNPHPVVAYAAGPAVVKAAPVLVG